MTFKELFTGADGIFTVFERNFPDDFKTLFGEMTAEQLNIFALGMYGNKLLMKFINADSWELFVSTFIEMNLFNWKRLFNAVTAEYEVTTAYISDFTKTGTEQVTASDNSENLTANKPFNSNNFDDGERQQRTGEKDENRTYNLHNKTIRSCSGGTITDNIIKEQKIRKKSLQKQIMSDIVNEITLSVYA